MSGLFASSLLGAYLSIHGRGSALPQMRKTMAPARYSTPLTQNTCRHSSRLPWWWWWGGREEIINLKIT